jgi:hypothetical protein
MYSMNYEVGAWERRGGIISERAAERRGMLHGRHAAAPTTLEKLVFCLTGPYLTRRATIGRLANSPLAEGGSLIPPYEKPPQV